MCVDRRTLRAAAFASCRTPAELLERPRDFCQWDQTIEPSHHSHGDVDDYYGRFKERFASDSTGGQGLSATTSNCSAAPEGP